MNHIFRGNKNKEIPLAFPEIYSAFYPMLSTNNTLALIIFAACVTGN
tara:strand:+ start:2922 stop:3062 length:141 start_codon:yes stop_codon:yes gene_type:complete